MSSLGDIAMSEFTDEMSNDQQLKEHKRLCNDIHDTYVQKNKAYGNSFSDTYEKLGIISAVTRITDKYNRLVTLAMNSNINKGDESIKDTLLDMANYCIMTVMEIEKREEKEIKEAIPMGYYKD